MANAVQLVYWDACVFLSYINETPGRIETLDAFLDEVEKSDGHKRIVTSVLSKIEVAYAADEKATQSLDPHVEEAIDFLWQDKSIVRPHLLRCSHR